MSTRSCIILKVRKEDIGKVMKFNAGLLPVPLGRWEDKDHEGKVWRDETGRNRCRPVEINDLYIGTYCHWDGYLSGVGDALKKRFNDYDSVLNLIIGGSCSCIENNLVRHYANRKKEKWSWIYPKQGKTQKSLVDLFNHCWCEFAYLFDESRGGWSYKTLYGKPENINKRGFKLIK
jgi:hypothetical protein